MVDFYKLYKGPVKQKVLCPRLRSDLKQFNEYVKIIQLKLRTFLFGPKPDIELFVAGIDYFDMIIKKRVYKSVGSLTPNRLQPNSKESDVFVLLQNAVLNSVY